VSSSSYRSQIERLKTEIADLERRAADERQRASREREAALRATTSITKSISPSTLRSKLAEAQRHEGRAADHDKRAAGFGSQVAAKTKQLNGAERSLATALGQERKRVEAEDRRRRDAEIRHIQELERRRRLAQAEHIPAFALPAEPLPERRGDSGGFEFDVCLSFAGEERAYVELVARGLKESGLRVFYDEDEKVRLWGKDLIEHFDRIYRIASRYCVMFISAAYAAKEWTRLERRSALARALTEQGEYILPVRFDDTELPGMPPTIAYIELSELAPATLVEFIVEKIGRPDHEAATDDEMPHDGLGAGSEGEGNGSSQN
jgi:hypothetical protein